MDSRSEEEYLVRGLTAETLAFFPRETLPWNGSHGTVVLIIEFSRVKKWQKPSSG